MHKRCDMLTSFKAQSLTVYLIYPNGWYLHQWSIKRVENCLNHQAQRIVSSSSKSNWCLVTGMYLRIQHCSCFYFWPRRWTGVPSQQACSWYQTGDLGWLIYWRLGLLFLWTWTAWRNGLARTIKLYFKNFVKFKKRDNEILFALPVCTHWLKRSFWINYLEVPMTTLFLSCKGGLWPTGILGYIRESGGM